MMVQTVLYFHECPLSDTRPEDLILSFDYDACITVSAILTTAECQNACIPSKRPTTLEDVTGQAVTLACDTHHMSALPSKADMCGATSNVRFGPKADIALIRSPRVAVHGNAKCLGGLEVDD